MAVIRVGTNGIADGTSGRDTIHGDGRNNTLYGFGGNDRIYGGGGNDLIYGHAGADTLTGGAGYDDFAFTTKPLKGSIDVITDYNKKHDTIILSKSVFKGIGKSGGWMEPDAFSLGDQALDADDRIIYNSKNGIVYYDPDGTGSKDAVAFVKLGKGKQMFAGDFWVF